MPKLPRGMCRRGKAYYFRRTRAGREQWIALGSDYQVAYDRFKALRESAVVAQSEMTVLAAARRWVETYCRTARCEQNVAMAKQRVERYLGPFMGPMMLTAVTMDDLRRYRLWLEGQGKSVQTVAHLLSDARCFFNWAEDTGLIVRAPIPRKLLPRLQERPPDRLSDADADLLLTAPEPYRFILALALGTGLRWGELCRVQAADLEGQALVIAKTKSGKVRRVPVPPELLGEIRQRVGRLNPYTQSCSFARMVGKLTGVQFHVHQLRHTFACQWLERGGSLAALQQILGHSSIVTTQRYARLSDEAVLAEAARLAGKSGKISGR